jgi:hypothetical protein
VALRPVKKSASQSPRGDSRKFRASRVPIREVVRLVDVGPGDPIWNGDSKADTARFLGSLVKLRPPAWASSEIVESIATSSGALVVRTAAPEPADAALTAEERAKVVESSLRAVVAELVAASAVPEDERVELAALCDQLLDEAGA